MSWREPYRSEDASGGPDTAEAVGLKWIEELANIEMARRGQPVHIETPRMEGDGRAIALYAGPELLAVATIFRDQMNFAVLVRWRAATLAHREGRSDG